MFVDETLDGVNFQSTWKREKTVYDVEIQTEPQLVSDEAVQSYKVVDEAVQTDEEPKQKLKLANDNSQALVDFLHGAERLISKQLRNNLRSRAFDGYEIGIEDDTSAVTNIHTLSNPDHIGQYQIIGYEIGLEDDTSAVTNIHTLSNPDHIGQYQITGLSWNSTGSVIAASYGHMDHEDWCTHRTTLCTWNVDRASVKEEKPDTKIEIGSCLMCIAFHPKNPAIIAGGTFNGEIMLWDLSREDDMLIASSGIGDDAHQEPVSKVYWITDAKGKKIYLVSTSSDGKILQWKIDRKAQKLLLKDGFMLMNQSLPRKMKVKGVRGDKEVGVTCVSYNSEDKDMFLVGSEAGAIFKCSMNEQGAPAGSHIQSSVPLKSPVTFTYNPHHGPVYAVDCSPFHRNAFISAGMDQCIRLYSILQAQPIMTIEPGEGYIYSAKWSPVRATVLAVTTQSGHLLIYDLKQGKPVPVHRLQASPQKQPVYACQFNPQQTHLLATGDATGFIQIFKLSSTLRTSNVKDTEYIGSLVNVSIE